MTRKKETRGASLNFVHAGVHSCIRLSGFFILSISSAYPKQSKEKDTKKEGARARAPETEKGGVISQAPSVCF